MSGYPSSYFPTLAAVEQRHWWHRGMRSVAGSLLGQEGRGPLLDAGCGTGGFLVWAAERGFAPLAGVDVSAEAVGYARSALPAAELHVAPLSALPFPDASFAVVACNDVLQHVEESMVETSLAEIRRVLRPGGRLLLRTNGARRTRRLRSDWRAYDTETVRAQLAAAGFRCRRISYVNTLGSLAAAVRGRTPEPPTATSHGIPSLPRHGNDLRYSILRGESALVGRGVRLPYGHTIVVLAVPQAVAQASPHATTAGGSSKVSGSGQIP